MLMHIAALISELLGTDDETSAHIFIVLATVIGGFLFIIMISFFIMRRSSKGTIYLVGVSDSGKSQMFWRLVIKGKTAPITVTSQVPNACENYTTKNNKMLRLIDIPGADKVRSSSLVNCLSQYKASGLIYVIDSSQIMKDCREIAECLYTLLADFQSSFGVRNFPILLACNKQDLPTAKSSKVVRSILEKEFALLNRTRAAALDQTSVGTGTGKKLLGGGGETFNFDNLPQNVQFVECSANSETDVKSKVKDVELWLDEF